MGMDMQSGDGIFFAADVSKPGMMPTSTDRSCVAKRSHDLSGSWTSPSERDFTIGKYIRFLGIFEMSFLFRK